MPTLAFTSRLASHVFSPRLSVTCSPPRTLPPSLLHSLPSSPVPSLRLYLTCLSLRIPPACTLHIAVVLFHRLSSPRLNPTCSLTDAYTLILPHPHTSFLCISLMPSQCCQSCSPSNNLHCTHHLLRTHSIAVSFTTHSCLIVTLLNTPILSHGLLSIPHTPPPATNHMLPCLTLSPTLLPSSLARCTCYPRCIHFMGR